MAGSTHLKKRHIHPFFVLFTLYTLERSQNDWKICENLFPDEFYMLSNNRDHGRIFALVTLLQRKCFSEKEISSTSKLPSEDDVIVQAITVFPRFQKSDCLTYEYLTYEMSPQYGFYFLLSVIYYYHHFNYFYFYYYVIKIRVFILFQLLLHFSVCLLIDLFVYLLLLIKLFRFWFCYNKKKLS